MAQKTVELPARPDGFNRGPNVVGDPTKSYITVTYGTNNVPRILHSTTDEVETNVSLETYERMENDPTIIKSKKIIVTKALADELQMAPGSTEDTVGEDEYEIYVQVMEMCQRAIGGLNRPLRRTLAMLLGNALRYGHGIAEVEYDYIMDGPNTRPSENKMPKRGKFASFFGIFKSDEQPKPIERPVIKGQKLRLMPKSILVKPRGAARFVVDEYMNVLGLAPRTQNRELNWNEVIRRDKFLVLTMNEQDEDPRGKSSYRPVYNWWNLKQNVPAEVLRYILEESVPKPVFTLPEDIQPYEPVRDNDGNVVYEADGVTPKMEFLVDSARRAVTDMRSGSGAVIPSKAKLEPYKKTSKSDAEFFSKILSMIDRQMEFGILLQNLAQSEGEHQARSASQVHEGLLDILIFFIRWELVVMITTDLLEPTIEKNLGAWALKYMPFVSLGDFVRRDWAKDLETVAKAYFYGFIDDTQRAELMAWLNMPRPGPSRQEVMAEADINGEPVMPNRSRPDKQPANKRRNDGNGTEKKPNDTNRKTAGLGPLYSLGHHGTRAYRSAKAVFSGRR